MFNQEAYDKQTMRDVIELGYENEERKRMSNLHPFICSVTECEEYVGSDRLVPINWHGLTLTIPLCEEHKLGHILVPYKG